MLVWGLGSKDVGSFLGRPPAQAGALSARYEPLENMQPNLLRRFEFKFG